jgi:hypothetical protein
MISVYQTTRPCFVGRGGLFFYGVAVDEGVRVGVGVLVLVGVGVLVGVRVDVGVLEGVGVLVAVSVLVAVTGRGVTVFVVEGVTGVSVRVGVAV